MSTSRFWRTGTRTETEKAPAVRLMQSANRAEIEAVKAELLKAGIAVECRSQAAAESRGTGAIELWLPNERDFFPAAEIYARTLENGLTDEPGNGNRSQFENEPPHEGLEEASTVLEKEIEDILEQQTALLDECGSLRGKIKELGRALAEAQSSLARETENRAAAERKQTEKLARLESSLEAERTARTFAEEQLGRERREWQQHLGARDESLNQKQRDLEAKERQLEVQEAAVNDLRTALDRAVLEREEADRALAAVRQELVREREAREAAEERTEQTAAALHEVEQQLAEQKHLEERMQSHLANINALCNRLQAKRAALVER